MVLLAGEQAKESPFADAQAQPSPYAKMNGRAVYQFAIVEVPRSKNRALEQANLTTDDIDWFLR